MTNLRIKNSKGSYLLEFAIVMPVLLLLVLASFDISRILSGYSAIRESANYALRCLYTADGDCVSGSTGLPSGGTPLYDFEVSPNQTLAEWQNYKGETSWLTAPVNRYEAEAAVVGNVSFDAPATKFTLNSSSFTSESTNYVTRSFPSVSGTPGNTSVSGGTSVTASGQISLSINSGSRTPTTKSVTFDVPTVDPSLRSLPCLIENGGITRNCTDRRTWPWADGVEFGNPVDKWNFNLPTGDSELTTKTFVVLQINGNTKGAGANGTSTVHLVLEDLDAPRRSPNNRYDLGGEESTGEADPRNFYVRGASPKWMSGSDNSSSPDEYNFYQAIEVNRGHTYRLNFTMERKDGTPATDPLAWNSTSITAYFPEYSKGATPLTCKDAKNLAECSSTCEVPLGSSKKRSITLARNSVVTSTDLGCFSSTEAANTAYRAALLSQPAGCLSLSDTKIGCGSAPTTVDCPSNFGVPSNLERDRSLLMSLCPVPTSANPASATWSITTEKLKGSKYEFSGCTKAPPAPPAEWNQYKNLTTPPHVVQDGSSPIYTGAIAPADYKKLADKDLNCDSVVLSPTEPIDSCYHKDGTPSLFITGSFYRADWERALRSEATSCGVPAGSYLALSKTVSWKAISGTPPTGVPIRFDSTGVWNSVAGNPYPEGTVPSICETSDHTCRKNLRGLTGGGAPTKTYEALAEAAVVRARGELSRLYPKAAFECSAGSAHCATINASLRDPKTPVVSVNLAVPLMFSSIFQGRDTVNISYSHSRTWEGELAANAR